MEAGMHATIRPLAICAVAALIQGSAMGFAFAQNAPAAHPAIPGLGPPSYSGPGWGPEEEPLLTPETRVPEDLPVLYVTSVEILHASAAPGLDIVRVTGLASSEGWSAPQLVPTYAGKPFDNVLDLELIATPPEQSEDATGFVQVSAIFPLEPGHPLAGVRVRGAENAMTVRQSPGAAQAQISINDCANCLGKKFASAGSAPQSQQNVVRQEELPKLLRILKTGDGIEGIEHDPNRLTLILDDDDTILEAFWE
jgi:hypothetical protein